MVTIQNIRENLSTAIKQSGLTQTEIAKRLNIKQQTVAQYVSGRALPALDTLANLCLILDVSSDYILGLEN